jgi:hypothetical protein
MQDAARPGKLRWTGLLALHTIIFVIGYGIAIRVIWGVVAILIRSGIQVDLATILASHNLWTAIAAGFVVGLIGITGIEAAFGRVGSRQSLISQPSSFVCPMFAAWFAVGVLRWSIEKMSQQSRLTPSLPRWLSDFASTFFLANCSLGWLISNFDSCSNQLAYTTLFVASLGYVAARLAPVRLFSSDPACSTALATAGNPAEEIDGSER